MKLRTRNWFWLMLSVIVVGISIGYFMYGKIFSGNTSFDNEKKIVLVYEEMDLSQWLELPEIANVFKSKQTLLHTAKLKKFSMLKSGRYAIKKGMNSNTIINMLRAGNQEPVRVRTDDIKTIKALAGKLGKALQYDSSAFIRAFSNPDLFPDKEYNSTNVACLFKPNTYDFLWTMTPEQFLDRMNSYQEKFWNKERLVKAKAVGLSKIQVTILASIVKAETSKNTEAPKIAGLYLNRLRIGMPLQSDPTAVFGAGIDHVQRVTNEISHVSAYNTYQNPGLPPGPINFPEEVYLDAVLNPEKHDFLYMCAQPGNTGKHSFAKTFEQHKIYARQYRNWLNDQGIR